MQATWTQCLPILDSLPVGVTIVDAAGRFTYANTEAARLYGMPAEDLIGRSPADEAFEPRTREGKALATNAMPHARVIESGASVEDSRYTLRRADGERVTISVDAAPMRDERGSVVAVVRSFKDVSEDEARRERLFAEREELCTALEESQELFRTVIETSREGIMMGEPTKNVLLYNAAMERITGYSLAEVVEHGWFELMYRDAESRAHAFDLAGRVTRGELGYTESEITRKDGQRRWISFSLGGFTHEGRQLTVAFVSDITDRMRLEAERQESVRQLREAFRDLDAVAHVTDAALSSIDLDTLLTGVLKEVVAALDASKAIILLLEDDVLTVVKAHPPLAPDTQGAEIRLSEGVSGYVARRREVLFVPDVREDPRALSSHLEREDIRSVLGVPLVHADECCGVLLVGWSALHDLMDRERRLAGIVGDRVAVAVDNARLHAETQAGRHYSEALSRIGAAVSSTLDVDTAARAVTPEAVAALGCDVAAIAFRTESGWLVADQAGSFDLSGTRLTPTGAIELAARTKTPVVVEDAEHDRRIDRRRSPDLDLRSFVITPLILENEVDAVIILGYARRHRFSPAELDFVDKLSYSLARAIANARTYRSQLYIANTVQQALLAVPETIEAFRVGHLYRAASQEAQVGGDFYDAFAIDRRRVAAALGDVSGKGVQASVLGALVKNATKALAYRETSPAAVLRQVNEVVYLNSATEMFVTMFLGYADAESHRLVYSSAGHPPPLLLRQGSVSRLGDASSLLGAFPVVEFATSEVEFLPGDMLLVYSDGVIEARGENASDQFGERRLRQLLGSATADDLEILPGRILRAVEAFTNGRFPDDIAILTLGYSEDQAEA